MLIDNQSCVNKIDIRSKILLKRYSIKNHKFNGKSNFFKSIKCLLKKKKKNVLGTAITKFTE
jgi:hypothetical protein